MERIDWNPSFSVGVKALDEEHERIVRMINLLISDPGATVRSETISELLDRLTKYASDHFRTEEQFLEEYGYPDLAGHKEEHKAYRIKMVALCQATTRHEESVPAELLKFIGDWWKNHILEADMKYRPFLTERGVK
jgi:hemerythrin-like metal-binding protein